MCIFLASNHRTCMVWCCMYSLRLLMMDGKTVRNMYSVVLKKINLRYCASGWFYYRSVFSFHLQLSSKTFIILRRHRRYIIINVFWYSSKVPIILASFQWNLDFFLTGFRKTFTQMSNLLKIILVGAELFRADGQTWRKLIVAFRNFANAPKY